MDCFVVCRLNKIRGSVIACINRFYIRRKESGIFIILNVGRRLLWRAGFIRYYNCMDTGITRRRPFNFLMCSVRKLERFPQRNCISFLIRRATRWRFALILHPPSQGRRLRCFRITVCLSGCVIRSIRF